MLTLKIPDIASIGRHVPRYILQTTLQLHRARQRLQYLIELRDSRVHVTFLQSPPARVLAPLPNPPPRPTKTARLTSPTPPPPLPTPSPPHTHSAQTRSSNRTPASTDRHTPGPPAPASTPRSSSRTAAVLPHRHPAPPQQPRTRALPPSAAAPPASGSARTSVPRHELPAGLLLLLLLLPSSSAAAAAPRRRMGAAGSLPASRPRPAPASPRSCSAGAGWVRRRADDRPVGSGARQEQARRLRGSDGEGFPARPGSGRRSAGR